MNLFEFLDDVVDDEFWGDVERGRKGEREDGFIYSQRLDGRSVITTTRDVIDRVNTIVST